MAARLTICQHSSKDRGNLKDRAQRCPTLSAPRSGGVRASRARSRLSRGRGRALSFASHRARRAGLMHPARCTVSLHDGVGNDALPMSRGGGTGAAQMLRTWSRLLVEVVGSRAHEGTVAAAIQQQSSAQARDHRGRSGVLRWGCPLSQPRSRFASRRWRSVPPSKLRNGSCRVGG